MTYALSNLVSFLILAAAVGVIGYEVATNFDRIVNALLRRPMR